MPEFRRLALAFLFTLVALPGHAQEPLHLRLSWAAVPGQMSGVLFEKTDILKHYGKSYVVDSVHIAGSGPQITAIATGDLQIAQFAPAAFALAVQNAHIADLRVIGDATRDGYQDYYTRRYAVAANSPIHSFEDLKGKVVATNSIGGAMDMAFRYYARKHGMEDKRDYSVVEIEFGNMVPALLQGTVALGALTTPYSIAPEKAGTVRDLLTLKDIMGESEVTIMAARLAFIEPNRAALTDFFEDAQRAMRWFYDPANRTEAIALVAKVMHAQPAAFSDWIFTKNDDYRDLDLRPNIDAMQRNIDVQRSLGLLKADLDVKHYVDLSMVNAAAKRPR